MQKKLYKELWVLRFKKMLVLEEDSIRDYESILKQCAKSKNDLLAGKLKQLIGDETRHAKLVRELIKIVNRQEE